MHHPTCPADGGIFILSQMLSSPARDDEAAVPEPVFSNFTRISWAI